MADLIDRQELISWISKDPLFPQVEAFGLTSVIESRPSVDAVPVVRCKDCIFGEIDGAKYFCRNDGMWCDGDWYCADGERREDGSEAHEG